MTAEIVAYRDGSGSCPFEEWFDRLPAAHALKVRIALGRLASGNTSRLKSVGGGVSEWRIDWGPGIRIYLAFDGFKLVILLGGGTKVRQQADIGRAIDSWADYTRRKKGQ